VYQPAHRRFEVADAAGLLAELSSVVPATLVTIGRDGLRASILPMLFQRDDGELGTLRGHLARGNTQWREIDAGSADALAIFDGPDAYVSPAWYEEKRRTGRVVPTWNYTTVHAYGPITLHHEPEWLLPHVRQLVDRHEAGRAVPWSLDDVPAGYAEVQVKAIVGLELRITRLEAKRKLSQNRAADDVAGVVDALDRGSPMERAVATEMRRSAPETQERDQTKR
jgi:transcriptional regulator